MKDRIRKTLEQTAELHTALAAQAGEIERLARLIIEALSAGRRLYVMGNGGSAADAQHMAGEMVGRFLAERRALPCVALSTDTSILTSVGNDYGFETVFRRQVEALVGEGDVVLGISTSGNSDNVNLALEEARRRGAVTLGLIGGDGGRMAGLCEACVCVRAGDTPRVQEGHQTIIHIICALVESSLCGG